jgi:serine/threonine protein kinase
LKTVGEAGLVHVVGLVDEHFMGFGMIGPAVKSLVIDVSAMTRMTSFGVRQWLKAMDGIPKTVTDLYLLGCPTFFVDQLNMVLNFGGPAKVLTVMAPYTCPSCGMESGETVDVLSERSTLAKGGVPEKDCRRCSGKLEFDETPESYFSFVAKYAASAIHPAASQLLSSMDLYTAIDNTGEKPPRIIKLVHGPVTYFRIIGAVGSMFRARPFLVGAEGEVVIDLAEVSRFDPLGMREWKRLLKTLASQVPAVTLVDLTESAIAHAGDGLTLARNIAVASVLLPYQCADCGKPAAESFKLENATWPLPIATGVCATCGGITQPTFQRESLGVLQKVSTSIPSSSSKLISNRAEVLSRALAEASVAQAGESATAALTTDSTILGKYKIVRRLSAGGMAEVFLATQVGIGGFEKPVALKRILRQLLESRHMAVDMFLNEAKIAGRLMHPNIVQVLDVGEESGALYLAMEYVRGKDLRELSKRLRTAKRTMPLEDACFIVREVAQALHHAYWSTDLAGSQLSVVHRDVSPHNVMLGVDGTVKLLDFGVAMSSVTESSDATIAGKWAYMSPEHTANQRVDHRSDLFSLGVMFYLLCTGAMPFAGNDPREIVKNIRSGNYKPLQQVAPHVPEMISHLIARMLASNPDERPQTGQEVATALSEAIRVYNFDCSQASITRLLGQVFGNELQENSRNSSDSLPPSGQHLASGSGSGRAEPYDSRGWSASSSTRRNTPLEVDVSVSLERKSEPFQRQSQRLASEPVPEPKVRFARVALITLMVVAVAVALYLVLNPQ